MVRTNEITGSILGSAIEVHRRLGPGLLESVYETCLAYHLQTKGHEVIRQKPVPVIFDDVQMDCGYRADVLVDSRVLVEVKSKEMLHPIDTAQLLSHLRLLKYNVGLLINFNEVKLMDGVRRLVDNYHD